MLANRICLSCRSTFQPSTSEEWWCSEECEGEIQELGRIRVAEEAEVKEMNSTNREVHLSEAQKARLAFTSGEREKPVDILPVVDSTDLLRAISSLSSLAGEMRDPGDGYLLLLIAQGYLEKAMARIEPHIRHEDSRVLDSDDLPEGPEGSSGEEETPRNSSKREARTRRGN
jgi:hypothetical protein